MKTHYKGTLDTKTFKDGMLTFIMGVPRVFEKIEEKFHEIPKLNDNSWLTTKFKLLVENRKSKCYFEGTFIEILPNK